MVQEVANALVENGQGMTAANVGARFEQYLHDNLPPAQTLAPLPPLSGIRITPGTVVTQ